MIERMEKETNNSNEQERSEEDQDNDDDDDDNDDDSWKKKLQSLAAFTKGNANQRKQAKQNRDSEDTDETASTTAADDSASSVPDLDLAATPMSSWSSASTSPVALSSLSLQRHHSGRPVPASSSKSSSLSKSKEFNLSQERQDIRSQATMVVVLMASSTALVVWTLLPVASIVAILVWLASLTVTLQVAYRALLIEYQYMLQHDGLRPYLPTSLYQQLTQTTLHEYMTDPSFGLEYRHLLLYFLPLSAEQLEYYLQRLAPRHQAVLRRPGLGFLFGEDVMRHVVGEPTFQQLQHRQQRVQRQQQQPPPTIMTPPSSSATTSLSTQPGSARPRQLLLQDVSVNVTGGSGGTSIDSNRSLDIHRVMEGHDEDDDNNNNVDDEDDDDASDLGLEINHSDLPGGTLTEQQASGMVQWLGLVSPDRLRRSEQNTRHATNIIATTAASATPLNPSLPTDSQQQPQPLQDPEDQQALEQEGTVIYDAFYSLFTQYSNMAYETVGQVVVDMVDATTPSLIQSSLGLTVVSASIALLGWWRGVYQFQQASRELSPHVSNRGYVPVLFTMTRTTSATWFPSPWFVRSTGLFGTAFAGTVALFRYSVRRILLPTPTTTTSNNKRVDDQVPPSPNDKTTKS